MSPAPIFLTVIGSRASAVGGFNLKNLLDQTLRESAKGLVLSRGTKRPDLPQWHQQVRVNVSVVAGSRSSNSNRPVSLASLHSDLLSRLTSRSRPIT